MILNLRETFLIWFKGLCIGGSMMIPGVSGGSMAMILGIYDKLISSISSFTKAIKKNILFLGIFCFGALIGLWLVSVPVNWLLEHYRIPTLFFFLGAVAGGLPLMFRSTGVKKISWRVFAYPALGFVFIAMFSFIPKGYFAMGSTTGAAWFLTLVLAGFLAAIALVLPGISVSYFFLLLGMLKQITQAITHLDITYLFPLGIGLLLGIFLSTKLLEKAMNNHPQPTYLIIIGFVLGSLVELFLDCGMPYGWSILIGLVTFSAGALSVWGLSKSA